MSPLSLSSFSSRGKMDRWLNFQLVAKRGQNGRDKSGERERERKEGEGIYWCQAWKMYSQLSFNSRFPFVVSRWISEENYRIAIFLSFLFPVNRIFVLESFDTRNLWFNKKISPTVHRLMQFDLNSTCRAPHTLLHLWKCGIFRCYRDSLRVRVARYKAEIYRVSVSND